MPTAGPPRGPALTWLLRQQGEGLVWVQAQHLAELLGVAGRVLGQDQYHVAGYKAVQESLWESGPGCAGHRGCREGAEGSSGASVSLLPDPHPQPPSPGPWPLPTGVSGPSPEPRACDVKLDQPNVLEVRGAGDSLVADHGCQEGPLL